MSFTQKELLKTVATWLRDLNIDYMVTGGWAIFYYGRIRVSHDVDFVVELGEEQAKLLEARIGDESEDFLLQKGVAIEAVKGAGVFTVMYLPTMDKVDFWIQKNSEFDKSKFDRKVKVQAWGTSIWLTSPEDTILQKLYWYKKGKSEKHIVDAAFVWQLQDNLDMEYINKWVHKLEAVNLLGRLDEVDLEEHY